MINLLSAILVISSGNNENVNRTYADFCPLGRLDIPGGRQNSILERFRQNKFLLVSFPVAVQEQLYPICSATHQHIARPTT
jgi:hypothetical protein